MDGLGDVESQGLEDIAYLSRSENRFLVLAALTADTPKSGRDSRGYDPRDLRERTGMSETTLNRILNEFQDRGWARRDEAGRYQATPAGGHVAAELEPTLESMAALRELGDAAAIVPTGDVGPGPGEGISIHLRHFRDATVRNPTTWDPTDTSRYYAELLDEASAFKSFVYVGPSKEIMAAMRSEIETGDLSSEAVFARPLMDRFRESPEVGPNRADVEAEGMRIYSYDGHLPCNLWVVDETVVIENSQVATVESGTILETQDEAVRDWALDLVDAYIDASEEIQPRELPSPT